MVIEHGDEEGWLLAGGDLALAVNVKRVAEECGDLGPLPDQDVVHRDGAGKGALTARLRGSEAQQPHNVGRVSETAGRRWWCRSG